MTCVICLEEIKSKIQKAPSEQPICKDCNEKYY